MYTYLYLPGALVGLLDAYLAVPMVSMWALLLAVLSVEMRAIKLSNKINANKKCLTVII